MNQGCFSVFLKDLHLFFSKASFPFSRSSLCLSVLTEALITAPNNVSVSTGEHNKRLWEVFSNSFILQQLAIIEKTQWDISVPGLMEVIY